MSFVNVYCWQQTYRSEVAEAQGWLFVRFCYDDGRTAYMQPVGEGGVEEALQLIFADAAERGEEPIIVGLDSHWREYMEQHYAERFAIHAPRSLSDYIYLASDLATLPGRKLQPKRNHINRFIEQHTYHLEPLSQENIGACEVIYGRWLNNHCRTCRREMAESRAMMRAFRALDSLPIEGWVLYADSEAVAYTYGSAINHDTFCIHIEKADPTIEGAATMINRLAAEQIAQRYRYINREEDMGLAGLRFAKSSYRPTMLLEKATARALTPRERSMRELWCRAFGDERATFDAFLIEAEDITRSFTTTNDAGEVVAMLHVVELRATEMRVAYIYGVATAEEHRGEGLASALITKALEWIDQSGRFDICALIPVDERAERLYTRFGFGAKSQSVRFATDYDFGTGCAEADIAMLRGGGHTATTEELVLTRPQ